MAYGLRIRFEFKDDQDSYYAVNLSQRDYSGAADVRELTGTPAIIEYGDSGADEFPIVLGAMASINFYAEDGDNWGVLYTADRRKFRLDIRKDNAVTGPIVFTGWLMTQEYSERLTWQPTLSIKAICGLGELKELDYLDNAGASYFGRKSYLQILTDLLAKLNLSLPIHTAIDWRDSLMVAGDAFAQSFVDVSIYNGLNCREVLDQILFGCRIMQRNGDWYIESYTALKRTSHTRYNYDYLGVPLSLSSETISPRAEINQMDVWTEGTPTLERWPAYDKLVLNQEYGRKESFFKNHKFTSGIDSWINETGVPTEFVYTAPDDSSESYVKLNGAQGGGIRQSISINLVEGMFVFRAKASAVGGILQPPAILGLSILIDAYIQVKLVGATNTYYLNGDVNNNVGTWQLTPCFVRFWNLNSEPYLNPFFNLGCKLNWVEIEKRSILPEAGVLSVYLPALPSFQYLGNPAYTDVVYANIVAFQEGDLQTGQTFTGLNADRYLDKKDDLKLLAGTIPENVNSALIWAGGLSYTPDGNDRADAWKMDSGTVTYGFCELMARMSMSLRRVPLTVMQANAIGANIGSVYNELNQPGIDFVFVGGSYDIQTRKTDGKWVELLDYSPDFGTISAGKRVAASSGDPYRASGNGQTRIFSSEGTPKRVNDLDSLTEVSNELSLEVDKTDYTASRRVSIGQVVSHVVSEIIENDSLHDYAGSGNSIPDTRTILLSGAIMWLVGFVFRSTKLIYLIIGEAFQISPQTIALDAADPTYARIDVLYVDSSSELQVLKGTPAAVPIKPTVPDNALEITYAYIPAGATRPDIEVNIVYDENAVGEWVGTETHDENISVNIEAAAAPAVGIKNIDITISIPDTAVATPTHYIGEIVMTDGVPYGKIFYLARGGKQGLIAALEDTALGVWWASLSGGGQSTGGRGTAIGTGQANTAAMLAQWKTKDHAVRYCDELVAGGYTDWFLGSQGDMLELYFRRFAIGGFANKMYWTSTEYDYKRAESINFANGVADHWDKNREFDVRAIRAFDDTLNVPGVPVEICTPYYTALNFVAPAPIEMNNGIVSFWMKSSVEWLTGTAMAIKLYNNSALVGRLVISKSSGMRGFNSADRDWQLIGIQASQFAMTGTLVNKVVFTLINSWPNNIVISIDQIRIQHDSHQVPEELITPGTYGEATKGLVITYNAQGKAIKIEEVDNVPADATVTAAKLAPDMVTTLTELAVDKVDPIPATTNGYSGTVIKLTAAVNLAFGDTCYINASGKATLASAATVATATGVVMCVDPTIMANDVGTFMLYGIARKDTWNWTVGGGTGILFLSIAGVSGNTLAQTVVSAEDQVSQILGFATHANRIFFNPSLIQTVYKA